MSCDASLSHPPARRSTPRSSSSVHFFRHFLLLDCGVTSNVTSLCSSLRLGLHCIMAPAGKRTSSSCQSCSIAVISPGVYKRSRRRLWMYILQLFSVLALYAAVVTSFRGFHIANAALANMKLAIAPLLGALSLVHTASSYSVYDLSDAKWTLSDPGNNVSVPATIPSQVRPSDQSLSRRY